MQLSFLLAAVLAPGPVCAREPLPVPQAVLVDELGPQRRGEIERRAAEWASIRENGLLMLAQFPDNVGRANIGYRSSDVRAVTMQVRDLLEQVKTTQIKINEYLYDRVRAEPPSDERDAREAAVGRLFRARMLVLYGNLLPRILDEGIKDGQGAQIGRRYAGPNWRVDLTFEEGQAYNRWLYRVIGVTAEEMYDYEKRARAELGLPPAQH